jgi:arginine:pyruvate transaminase
MMRFSALVERVAGRETGARSLYDSARRRRAAGEDIITLLIGDPDQPPPAVLIEATIAALRGHRTGYSPTLGTPALRAAIAARHASRSGQKCGADNVVVVPGAQGGLYCALQCLAGPGDEVVVPEPVYATYPGVIAASGARMVMVPLDPERGFHPDIARIEAAITPRTRVLWINTPHNPTGAVFTADEMAALAAVARRRDLWLLSDEVYEDLAFARPHVGAWSLPGMEGRTVVVSSLSKSHAVPAFRLGWIIGPTALAGHLNDLLLAMTYGSPAFIQEGALAAFATELADVAALREDYRRRAVMFCRVLAEAPNCRAAMPEGGMFVMLDIRPTGLGALEFAQGLLEREAVAVMPGDGFGPSAQGHLRIALCEPDARLADAGNRIVRFARHLAGSKGLAAGWSAAPGQEHDQDGERHRPGRQPADEP